MSNAMMFTLDSYRGSFQERDRCAYGARIDRDMFWEPCILKHDPGYDCGSNNKINFSRSKKSD
jgi:hypothetical protein